MQSEQGAGLNGSGRQGAGRAGTPASRARAAGVQDAGEQCSRAAGRRRRRTRQGDDDHRTCAGRYANRPPNDTRSRRSQVGARLMAATSQIKTTALEGGGVIGQTLSFLSLTAAAAAKL